MNQQKFNTWLKLWRLGLAPDPEIVSIILDVSKDETHFYERVSKRAEELQSIGLIRGTKGLDDPISMDNQYWMGPEEVADLFTEAVNSLLEELKQKHSHRNFVENEAYMGFRYWSVNGGVQPMREWRNYWLGSATTPTVSVN